MSYYVILGALGIPFHSCVFVCTCPCIALYSQGRERVCNCKQVCTQCRMGAAVERVLFPFPSCATTPDLGRPGASRLPQPPATQEQARPAKDSPPPAPRAFRDENQLDLSRLVNRILLPKIHFGPTEFLENNIKLFVVSAALVLRG